MNIQDLFPLGLTGCDVGAKTNWNMDLSLSNSNLCDIAVLKKELVPFTMKLCKHLTYSPRD